MYYVCVLNKSERGIKAMKRSIIKSSKQLCILCCACFGIGKALAVETNNVAHLPVYKLVVDGTNIKVDNLVSWIKYNYA